MTYKQKLIDLLKSDDKTKEAIEKLEFGTEVIGKYKGKFISARPYAMTHRILILRDGEKIPEDIMGFVGDLEIIGLPLQERFIQIYLEKYKRVSYFNTNGIVQIHNEIENTFYDFELDNTKDFDNQSEEVYSKIYEALNNLIK